MSREPLLVPEWTDPDPVLDALTRALSDADSSVDEAGTWSGPLWDILVAHRVPLWSFPESWGGDDCERPVLIERYARIAEGSLTAAFILSQHDAGVRRLLGAVDRPNARVWLDAIARAEAFTTVGISQLTTSQRLGPRALRIVATGPETYRLDGVMPWVTAAGRADVIVTGAAFEDGRQALIALPARRAGVVVRPPFALAALGASCTSEVVCDAVEVAEADLLAGPALDIMTHPNAAGTGGLETSALALGQARAALRAVADEVPRRADLAAPVSALADSWRDAWSALMAAGRGDADAPTPAEVRGQANALVLRTTQSYLTARKGTGFLRSEPAQRWARQALFFLVWSCPGPVAQATMRELAGLCPEF